MSLILISAEKIKFHNAWFLTYKHIINPVRPRDTLIRRI